MSHTNSMYYDLKKNDKGKKKKKRKIEPEHVMVW